MPLRPQRFLAAALAAVATMALMGAPARAEPDITQRLAAIPGMTVLSESADPPEGYRFLILAYTQPVDHDRPHGQTFQQRFHLLHKDTSRPMVLHTNGYWMPPFAFRTEPTLLLDGNQISVEQRFFTPSRPEPADWRKLDIRQAAADHHRLITALKPVYRANWISTGASKGGMASVYHHRYYPRDVDGVVAYVTPNDRINRADSAYDRFFATVGDDPECRARLDGVQRQALQHRSELVRRYAADAAAKGWTFESVLGSVDRAFEMTVLDSVWTFWQYAGAADCPGVPGPGATPDVLYAWIDKYMGWSYYTDEGIDPFIPYYYQAATELGWASLKFEHLRGLTRYPGLYSANSALPRELRSHHRPWPVLDVDHWVRTRGSRMLFVYGENDPWGAEAFVPSNRDSYSFTVPGGNHGSEISGLTPHDRDVATEALSRWAGVSVDVRAAAAAETGPLDAAERDLRRDRFRLTTTR